MPVACPTCGTENPDKNRFCNNCGGKIAAGTAAATTGAPAKAAIKERQPQAQPKPQPKPAARAPEPAARPAAVATAKAGDGAAAGPLLPLGTWAAALLIDSVARTGGAVLAAL